MDEILGYEEFDSLVDELQNEETPLERRTEILLQMKQERGMVHTKFDADTQKVNKLEELNASIKATNQQLWNERPPAYVSPNHKEQQKQSEREEKISKVNLNDLNNF